MYIVKFLMFGLLILAMVSCDAKQTLETNDLPPVLPSIASTRQLMLAITAPTSDEIFQLGIQEPASDAEWEKLVASALSLAESANLLKFAPRAVDRQDWIKFSDDLIFAAKIAAAAASDRDAEAVMQAGGPIYQSCVTCHQKYGSTPVSRRLF